MRKTDGAGERTLLSIFPDYSTVEFSATEQLAGFQSQKVARKDQK